MCIHIYVCFTSELPCINNICHGARSKAGGGIHYCAGAGVGGPDTWRPAPRFRRDSAAVQASTCYQRTFTRLTLRSPLPAHFPFVAVLCRCILIFLNAACHTQQTVYCERSSRSTVAPLIIRHSVS